MHWHCLACGATQTCRHHPRVTCTCGVERSWITEQAVSERATRGRAVLASEIPSDTIARIQTGLDELDDLLGGGFAEGSAILIHGRRGSGKSRVSYSWAAQHRTLIICPELSIQIAREILASIGADLSQTYLLPSAERWQSEASMILPKTIVVDSLSAASHPLEALKEFRHWAQCHRGITYLIQQSTKANDHRGHTDLSHWSDYEIRFGKPTPTASVTRCELLKTRIGPTGIATAPLNGTCN